MNCIDHMDVVKFDYRRTSEDKERECHQQSYQCTDDVDAQLL